MNNFFFDNFSNFNKTKFIVFNSENTPKPEPEIPDPLKPAPQKRSL